MGKILSLMKSRSRQNGIAEIVKSGHKLQQKGHLGVPAIKQVYKPNKTTAESDQTVTLGGSSLFFNKRRISDMRLQAICSFIADLPCHDKQCYNLVARF